MESERKIIKFILRPARQEDASSIRALIHRVEINPIGLDWRRFTLAVDSQDQMLGCGQLKRHSDGSLELASIAVEENWRGQGIAAKIIEYLISTSPSGPLYLTCRANLGSFYERFGFITLTPDEMPSYFRRIYRIFTMIRKTGLISDDLLVMRKLKFIPADGMNQY